jgi:hypothetical protein
MSQKAFMAATECILRKHDTAEPANTERQPKADILIRQERLEVLCSRHCVQRGETILTDALYIPTEAKHLKPCK